MENKSNVIDMQEYRLRKELSSTIEELNEVFVMTNFPGDLDQFLEYLNDSYLLSTEEHMISEQDRDIMKGNIDLIDFEDEDQ